MASITAGRASEDETAATIRALRRETGYVADPHTAVALAVAEKEPRDAATPMVVLSTAHPAKFPDAVEAATGIRPGLPPRMADLFDRPERVARVPNDLAALEALVRKERRA